MTDTEGFSTYVHDIEERLRHDSGDVVLADARERITGGELLELIHGLATALVTHGVRRGHRVALVAPATGEAIAVRYAAALLGASTVYCPDAGSPARLQVFLSRIGADAVIVFPSTAASVGGSIGTNVLAVGRVPGLPDLLTEVRSRLDGAGPDAGQVSSDDECVLVATGGTTGVSKASVRTHGEYRRLVDLGPTPGRRQLICTPLAYIAQTLVDTVLLGGGQVFLQDGYAPAAVLRAIADERITHLALVEPLLVELLDSEDLAGADLSSVVGISHVGADAASSLRRRLLRRVGRSILVNPYGASEFGVVSMLTGPDYSVDSPHLATSGRPVPSPSTEVQIRTGDGRLCPPLEEGIIHVRTSAQAHGYSFTPPHSGFTDDGWFSTGDVGLFDEDGYLLVRGRADDRRLTDAGSVFPVDIQEALCSQPGVRYAVAVPAPGDVDAVFGAVVVLHPDATPTIAELTENLRTALPLAGEISLEVVDEVPVTEQGKPSRPLITARLFGDG
ncbi:class I adenylate-forming enzyme family protein [Gordonia sp. AC31]|uniref:class I adenylate-forming enzyme family protein n=1 Tax=Gordonia sp. AC31 TaxID=2962571 RepID=UPI0028817FC4|nr:class I adenylate-forming enzyme family protein [Gordonia sp. AC31]MDT0223370.1 class I adenylate-forming enzyme family protein [Gordonia sp. AC31]